MRRLFIAALILIFLLIQPLSAFAAEPVQINRACSLELDYSSNGVGFSGLEIRIYRIAALYPYGGDFALVWPFYQYPVNVNPLTSPQEWRDASDALASYIAADQIEPTAVTTTDSSGKAVFTDLHTGIYLVLGVTAETQTHIYQFDNFSVFLPTAQSDGTQNYDVKAKPKQSLSPKPEEPKLQQYQVLKLWKDSGDGGQRPQSVTVDILKDDTVQETVILNAGNNWTYSWTAEEGDGDWSVVEKEVPEGYTVSIRASETNFTITNTQSEPTDPPPKPPEAPTEPQETTPTEPQETTPSKPQETPSKPTEAPTVPTVKPPLAGVLPRTGDTFALRRWLMIMNLSGILLLVCGCLQKRKSR